jgi:hypothetical protein
MFKDAVKKLGPNATQRSIDRICHAMGVAKQLTENFDSSMTLYKRSGIHSRKSDTGDLKKIVNELLFQNALAKLPGRSYGFFSEIKPSLLSGFYLQKCYAWISEHKKYMIPKSQIEAYLFVCLTLGVIVNVWTISSCDEIFI